MDYGLICPFFGPPSHLFFLFFCVCECCFFSVFFSSLFFIFVFFFFFFVFSFCFCLSSRCYCFCCFSFFFLLLFIFLLLILHIYLPYLSLFIHHIILFILIHKPKRQTEKTDRFHYCWEAFQHPVFFACASHEAKEQSVLLKSYLSPKNLKNMKMSTSHFHDFEAWYVFFFADVSLFVVLLLLILFFVFLAIFLHLWL